MKKYGKKIEIFFFLNLKNLNFIEMRYMVFLVKLGDDKIGKMKKDGRLLSFWF